MLVIFVENFSGNKAAAKGIFNERFECPYTGS